MKRYPAGTLNLEKVQDGIFDWIRDVTLGVLPDGEVQIIWRNQSEPLPARPCVTLKIIDGPRPIARSGNLFFNAKNAPFSVGVQMEMTLSVQIFGNTKNSRPIASQLAIDLNSSLLRQTILDKLKSAGLSVQTVGHPTNLTALEETEYEERSGFEVGFGLAQNMQDSPDTIETVNVEINTPSGDRTREVILP